MDLAMIIPLALLLSGLFFFLLYLILRPSTYHGLTSGPGVAVHVLVLGDIGRSPRMTYHALSIAKQGGQVTLIGYLDTTPHPSLLSNPSITIHPLPSPPRRPVSLPFLLFAPYKVLAQLLTLTLLLAYTLPPAHWLLVQNPPSIPTLAIASLICRLRKTSLLIDWHNYGWTILASTRGATHPLVRLARHYETFFGRLGTANLAVTHAMARELARPPYAVPGPLIAVHDRPAAIFQPVSLASVRAQILRRVFPALADIDDETDRNSLLSGVLEGDRRLLVSSTSWTPDEDFSLLLDALERYAANPGPKTPVLVVVTGEGPQRAMYRRKIAELAAAGKLPGVRVATAFLPFADYAGLLACADLGVCLHMSSSGVDLPMKVVDMFGAGLPVAAYAGYESFGELVREGENGRGFETAEELAGILTDLLGEQGGIELSELRRGAVREGSRRWDEEWDETVGVLMGFTKGKEIKS